MIRILFSALIFSAFTVFGQDTINERIKIEPFCFFENNGTFFINSEEDYGYMIERYKNEKNKDCFDNFKFPDVDLDKYSILGFTSNPNGCKSDNTIFTLTATDIEGHFKVSVLATEDHICDEGIYVCEWYLYPKMKWSSSVSWDANFKYTSSEEE